MTHGMNRGDIPDDSAIHEDIKNMREVQEYILSKLDKYGVDPKSYSDRKNGSYWKWYDFWHTWHKEKLSDDDWKEVNRRMMAEENYDEFLPKTKWND